MIKKNSLWWIQLIDPNGSVCYYICLDLDLIKLNGFSGFDQREQKDVYVKLPGRFCGLNNNSIGAVCIRLYAHPDSAL